MSEVLYRYRGDGSEYLGGVPARDVTLDDWELLEDAAKEALQAHAGRKDGLYERVSTVAETRGARRGRRGRARKTQVDTDVSGRVDSDVIGIGQAVPPTDEPVGEGSGGFVQVDTGGAAASKEG